MTWTTPVTWTSGTVITATTMNLHVRDNLQYLYDLAENERLFMDTSHIGTTTTGTDDLMSYFVPADLIVTEGQGVDVFAWGAFAATTDTKTLKFHVDLSSVTIVSTSSTGDTHWVGKVTVMKYLFAAGGVRIQTELQTYQGLPVVPDYNTRAGLTELGFGVKFTGAAIDSSGVTQDGMIVTLLR